jgi:hypothetical protein
MMALSKKGDIYFIVYIVAYLYEINWKVLIEECESICWRLSIASTGDVQ